MTIEELVIHMKKSKCTLKKGKKFIKKFVNGKRGAVSLLMALVVSPLLSISLLLVESSRYQNAEELMREVIDSSAFSTLAEYDPYLDERFGLLSVSQGTDIQQEFSGYLQENISALGKSVTINSYTAVGVHPLSTTDVLKQQILEYSEINVAAEMAIQGFNIDQYIEELEEQLGLEQVNKKIEEIQDTVDVATEMKNVVEAINGLVNKYSGDYTNAIIGYQNAYANFESSALELINTLKEAESNLQPDESPDAVYDNSAVQTAVNNLLSDAATYKSAASSLKTQLTELKDDITGLLDALTELQNKSSELDQTTSGASQADESTIATKDWMQGIESSINSEINSAISADYSNLINQETMALQNQMIALGDIDKKTITSSWTGEDISSAYGMIPITSIGAEFLTILTKLQANLDIQATKIDSEDTSELLAIVTALSDLSGLYDGDLNSVLDTSRLYAKVDMSFSSKLVINCITSLSDAVKAGDEFLTSGGITGILKALEAIIKLLGAIVNFLLAVVAWAGEAIGNLVTFIAAGPTEWYNNLLLYGYAAYNLPNRTNYASGKSLSGFEYSELFDMAGGQESTNVLTGSIKAAESFLTFDEESGSDKIFKGAATEYILIGSNSEVQNQSAAFFSLYLFRLLCDLQPALTNKEVTAMSTAAGPLAWVVKLAVILAEPMLDTYILINSDKSSVCIIKKTLYLTPSGIPLLMEDLKNVTAMTDELKDKIKKSIESNYGSLGKIEKGYVEATYVEHLLLLMILSVNQNEYMQRMQNLIQLEASAKNEAEFDFDLDKAYTYIKSEVDYTLNPMLKLDNLTKNGLFSVTSQQYTGY